MRRRDLLIASGAGAVAVCVPALAFASRPERRGLCHFYQGQELGPQDLAIAYPFDLEEGAVWYSIYFVDMSGGSPGVEILIGHERRVPVKAPGGWYYPPLRVPPTAVPAEYIFRWHADVPDLQDGRATRTRRSTVDCRFWVVEPTERERALVSKEERRMLRQLKRARALMSKEDRRMVGQLRRELARLR